MKNLDGWMSEKSDKSIVNLNLPKYGSSHLSYSNTSENIDKIDLLTEQTEQKQNNGETQENKFMLAKATCEEGKFKLELDKNNNQIVTININKIGESKLTKDHFLLPMRGNEKDSTKEPVELPKKRELDLFKNDKSLRFDGLKDYLKIPHNDKFNFNNQDDFTIEVWLKIDREQLDKEFGDNSIIEKWSSDEKAGYPFAIRYEQETGRIWAQQYYVIDQNRGKIESVNSIKENETTGEPKIVRIDDGLFHHIAFVKKGGELSLYIDKTCIDKTKDIKEIELTPVSESDKSDNTNSNSSTANKSALYIACRGRSNNLKTGKKTGNHFRGQIDEIRIWKVARDQTQIQAKSSDLEFDSLKLEDKENLENLVGFWDFTNKNINNKINNNDYSEVHGDPQWSTQTRRNYFSAVDHQEKDLCTAYTIASAFEYSIRRATGNDIRISRSFIHQNAKFLSSIDNSSEDDSSGVSIKAVLKGMQIFGVLDEKYWQPNNHKLDDNAKTIAYVLAQKDPLKQYLNLYRSGMEKINLLDQIKLFICAEFPIIFGLPLSETVVSLSEYNQGQIPFQFFCKKTGHTLLAVGYDDDKVITGYQEVFCDGDGINPKLTSKLNDYPNDIESKINSLLNKFLSCRQENKKGNIVVELNPEKNNVLENYLTIQPYDKNDQILQFFTKGAFKVRNSWGPGWGEQGYGWLPYAYLLTGLATDWYCIFNPEWNEMGGWGINNLAPSCLCTVAQGNVCPHGKRG